MKSIQELRAIVQVGRVAEVGAAFRDVLDELEKLRAVEQAARAHHDKRMFNYPDDEVYDTQLAVRVALRAIAPVKEPA